MSTDKIRTALRLLKEAGDVIAADTYWLTRDEQDMFERLLSELERELREAYAKKGVTDV